MRRLVSPGLVFPAIAIALFPKALTGQGAFFHYDTWMQNFAFRAWWFGELKQGTFATWCPGMFAGYPLFAETQTGALYPLTFPLFLLLPATLAFSWSVILHFARRTLALDRGWVSGLECAQAQPGQPKVTCNDGREYSLQLRPDCRIGVVSTAQVI